MTGKNYLNLPQILLGKREKRHENTQVPMLEAPNNLVNRRRGKGGRKKKRKGKESVATLSPGRRLQREKKGERKKKGERNNRDVCGRPFVRKGKEKKREKRGWGGREALAKLPSNNLPRRGEKGEKKGGGRKPSLLVFTKKGKKKKKKE